MYTLCSLSRVNMHIQAGTVRTYNTLPHAHTPHTLPHCTHTSHPPTLHIPLTPTHTPHTVMRQALPKLIEYTTEPKSAEVRRQSQKVLTRLFDLNPATLSLMLNALPRILQESANRILQCYVADMSSSGEESDREKSTSPKKTSPAQRKVCVWCVYGVLCRVLRYRVSIRMCVWG